MSLGLAESGVCLLHQNSDRRYDLAENLPPAWTGLSFIGQTGDDVLPSALAREFGSADARCRSVGEKQTVTFELGEGSLRRAYQATLLCDDNGVTTVIRDQTDKRAREAAVNALLREVSHRSKNLLAIVQSVAMQTAHHSGGIKEFLDKFRGRLHALSGTQDLVTESNWRGAHLKALITAQLTRVGAAALRNVRIAGENPLLGPNASLHVGLALHELSANAMAYGALGDARGGSVAVDAAIDTDPENPGSLVLEWHETFDSRTTPQGEPRFGSLVLERIVPLSVGGHAHLDIGPRGVAYRLVVPADQFET